MERWSDGAAPTGEPRGAAPAGTVTIWEKGAVTVELGLVSNLTLIFGVSGSGSGGAASTVLLTRLAVLLAGAVDGRRGSGSPCARNVSCTPCHGRHYAAGLVSPPQRGRE